MSTDTTTTEAPATQAEQAATSEPAPAPAPVEAPAEEAIIAPDLADEPRFEPPASAEANAASGPPVESAPAAASEPEREVDRKVKSRLMAIAEEAERVREEREALKRDLEALEFGKKIKGAKNRLEVLTAIMSPEEIREFYSGDLTEYVLATTDNSPDGVARRAAAIVEERQKERRLAEEQAAAAAAASRQRDAVRAFAASADAAWDDPANASRWQLTRAAGVKLSTRQLAAEALAIAEKTGKPPGITEVLDRIESRLAERVSAATQTTRRPPAMLSTAAAQSASAAAPARQPRTWDEVVADAVSSIR